ncbi:MAG: hypothetical protein OXQ29_27825 [Rhodospirillaceae bacterium]|nr:hypothetical protein [Rhodospirillaceae bacterium]
MTRRIDQMREEWEADQAARVENADDEILALANEVYADMVEAQTNRIRGERQKGALAGLGFKAWIGPWGGYTSPDRPSAQSRILNSLRHKPYFGRLAAAGLSHPERNVGMRAEWLRPYCVIDTALGMVSWGLGDTRERAELFNAKYDIVELLVLDQGEVVARVESEQFDNGNSLHELGLDDDDYRFQVGARNVDWGYTGKWFDFAIVDGVWTDIGVQGADWDGEYGDSGVTHSGDERVTMETAAERASRVFAKSRNRAPSHLVARARQYYEANKNRADRNHGLPWKRVLIAFDAMVDDGAGPMTAAEARESERAWSGWRPFREALEKMQ